MPDKQPKFCIGCRKKEPEQSSKFPSNCQSGMRRCVFELLPDKQPLDWEERLKSAANTLTTDIVSRGRIDTKAYEITLYFFKKINKEAYQSGLEAGRNERDKEIRLFVGRMREQGENDLRIILSYLN